MSKITIVGAGNVGTQTAVHCALKGYNVKIFTSNYKKINSKLYIVDEESSLIYSASIAGATDNIKEAFEEADIVFVTVPAMIMKNVADKIKDYANDKMKICLLPGTGGAEWAFKECIERGATVFGLQRVPSVARLIEYGKKVKAVGYRNELFAAAIPKKETAKCCKIIENIFDIKTFPLPNYFNITLTPPNPILHTTRLKTIFRNYSDGIVYENVPLFYEDWDDKSSELLLKCDNEVQKICSKLNKLDLSYVKSLKEHYNSFSVRDMTEKISSIKSFKGLKSPTVERDNGLIPDFNSRYFTADFPYGLSILVQIANYAGIEVPNMTQTLDWYHNVTGNEKDFDFKYYGVDCIEKLEELYML